MPRKKIIDIMLLDDHPFILHGLQANLSSEPDIRILGSYSTSSALIGALQNQQADLVLLDYALGPDQIDGLNLIRGLKIRFPATRLLVLSALHNAATVSMAIRIGADGFIGKEIDSDELSVAIRRVAQGKTYLAADMKELIRDNEIRIDPSEPADTVASVVSGGFNRNLFTAREYEVIRCCLEGFSVTQIATKFKRSIKTISTQKHSAFKKMGIRTDNELYKFRDHLEGL